MPPANTVADGGRDACKPHRTAQLWASRKQSEGVAFLR